MKVSELIELLLKYDQDATIRILAENDDHMFASGGYINNENLDIELENGELELYISSK